MAGYGNFVLDKGYEADGPIGKCCAVKQGSTDGSVAVAGAGDLILGFNQFEVTQDDIDNRQVGSSVRLMGISEAQVKVGQTVRAGHEVTTDTDGVVKEAVIGDHVCGVALTTITTGTAGQRVAVLIYRYRDTDVS